MWQNLPHLCQIISCTHPKNFKLKYHIDRFKNIAFWLGDCFLRSLYIYIDSQCIHWVKKWQGQTIINIFANFLYFGLIFFIIVEEAVERLATKYHWNLCKIHEVIAFLRKVVEIHIWPLFAAEFLTFLLKSDPNGT